MVPSIVTWNRVLKFLKKGHFFGFVELLQSANSRDSWDCWSLLGNFHIFFCCNRSKRIKILPKLHHIISYMILKNKNHSVIFRALIYLQSHFHQFLNLFLKIFQVVTSKKEEINPWNLTHSFSNVLKCRRINFIYKCFLNKSRE